MIEYKGYFAEPRFENDDNIFYGELLGIRDVITFEGKTVDEIRQAFQDAVNHYLEWCQEENVEPQKPFSGKFVVRIDPNLHARVANTARNQGKSINQWVSETIEKAAE